MGRVCVVGSFVQDLAFQTASFPSPGETRIGKFRSGPGGKGFNQAVAAARQGAHTTFIGAVGDDAFGRGAKEFADNEGIAAALEIVRDAPSGAAAILVGPRAENMIVVALGANDRLSNEFLRGCREAIADADVLVCQLECALEPVEAALWLARESGTLSILNPAPINERVSRKLLADADIIVPNESELSFLAGMFLGKSAVNVQSGEELLSILRALGPRRAVVTLGEAGCVVFEAGGSGQNFFRIPVVKVEARDTTGAGDAFCGGLAAALSDNPGDLRAAAMHATVVAALSVTQAGTAPAMPTREETAALASERGLTMEV